MISKILSLAAASPYNMIVLNPVIGKEATAVTVGALGLGVDAHTETVDVPVHAILEPLKLKGWNIEPTTKGFTATRRRASVRPPAMSAAA